MSSSRCRAIRITDPQQARPRRDGRGRARRSRALQARSGGLRAVEAAAPKAVIGWDSPWGRGRPGWHIECSAMIKAHLGETIDIHGGGLDLIFPHHENEIAQSRCAHGGTPLARYWVHNGFVDMGAEKMSKSLGNIVTPGELLAQGHRGETLRLALLSAHYRAAAAVDRDARAQAKATLDRTLSLRLETPAERSRRGRARSVERRPEYPLALSRLSAPRRTPALKASAQLLGHARLRNSRHEQLVSG